MGSQPVADQTASNLESMRKVREGIAEKRYAEAEQAITDALHNSSAAPAFLYVALAEIRNAQQDFDAAEEFAQKALAKDQACFDAKFQLANAFFGRYEVDKAEALFAEIEDDKKDDPSYLLQLGRLYLHKRDTKQALDYANRSAQLKPDVAAPHVLKAEALLSEEKIKQAVAAAKKAKQVERADSDAWRLLIQATLLSGDRKAFDKILQSASKALPGSPVIDTTIAEYLATNKSYEDAEIALLKVLKNHPDYAPAYQVLSRVYVETGRSEQAVDAAYKALGFAPYSLTGWKQMGVALSRNEEYTLAVGWLHKALLADPEDLQLAAELAYALYQLHEFDAANDLYRQILAEQPDNATFLHAYGLLLIEMERNSEAVKTLKRAHALDGDNVIIQLTLATALADGNDFAAARNIYLDLMRRKPEVNESFLYYTAITKMAEDEEITAEIEQKLSGMVDPRQQEMLHYALAKIYEDKREFEVSFSHLRTACSLHKERCGYKKDAYQSLFKYIKTVFTKEFIERFTDCGSDSRRPVFVLGMPRSGTTLVEQVLASHPAIEGGGELRFIDAVLGNHAAMTEGGKVRSLSQLACEHLPELANTYLSLIAPMAPEEQMVVDKMPTNFFYIGFIVLMFPNARIIHVNRNPMATCLSCYKQQFTEGHAYSYDLEDLGRHYLAYLDLMTHWRQVLPEGRMLEVEYEALTSDFEPQARRLIDYCGLEWDDACLKFHENKRAVRTASLAQVRKPVYTSSVSFWQNYEQQLKPLYDILHEGGAV